MAFEGFIGNCHPAADLCYPFEYPGECPKHGSFALARFADQAEGLSAFDRKGSITHCMKAIRAMAEYHVEAADINHRIALALPARLDRVLVPANHPGCR